MEGMTAPPGWPDPERVWLHRLTAPFGSGARSAWPDAPPTWLPHNMVEYLRADVVQQRIAAAVREAEDRADVLCVAIRYAIEHPDGDGLPWLSGWNEGDPQCMAELDAHIAKERAESERRAAIRARGEVGS